VSEQKFSPEVIERAERLLLSNLPARIAQLEHQVSELQKSISTEEVTP
jgi:hypothetical protein